MTPEENHIHSFETTVVPATCTQRGYTLHKCQCGYEHKDSFTPVGVHEFVLEKELSGDCTVGGTRQLRCAHCGQIQQETTKPLGHSWGDWNVQAFATCTESGLQVRQCSRCGQTQEQPIPAKGHKRSKGVKNAQGKMEYYCLNCGQPLAKNEGKPKANKKVVRWIAAILAIIVLGLVGIQFLPPIVHYTLAKIQMQTGDYQNAYFNLLKSGFLQDEELLKEFRVEYRSEESVSTSYNEDGKQTEKSVTKVEYDYDKYGNLTLHIRTNEDGKTKYEYGYEYNTSGKPIQQVSYTYNKFNGKTVWEYDQAGHQTSEAVYDRNGALEKKTLRKYSGDTLIQETHINKYDKVESITNYTYDAQGNLVLTEKRDADGDIIKKDAYQYDADGNKILWESFGNSYINGMCISKTECLYNDDGKIEQETRYDASGNWIEKYCFEYDQEGNEILETIKYSNASQVKKYRTRYEYDRYGNILKETRYTVDGDISATYEYEKDLKSFKVTLYHMGADGDVISKTETKYSDPYVIYLPSED